MIAIVYQSIEPATGPTGRGGLLIVVAAGLVYTALTVPLGIVREWLPMFLNSETWAILADPPTHGFHPALPAFLMFRFAITVLVGFAALVGLVLFAQRAELFPKYMIGYYLGSFVLLLAVNLVEVRMWSSVFGDMSHYGSADAAGKAMLWALAAVPYFARSRRVKNTFVKRRVETAEPGQQQACGPLGGQS